MRVPNNEFRWVGFRMNLLGVRVFDTHCQLIGRQDSDWVTIGGPRSLPVVISDNAGLLAEDPLLLTAYQYDAMFPGTDLRELLAQRKSLDEAFASL